MKLPRLPHLQVIFLAFIYSFSYGGPNAGFFLPDSVEELSIRFRSFRDLIIIPVTINGNIRVNLILDTGCRNLVLFGKKFQKVLRLEEGRIVQFSGLGAGKHVNGKLSISNNVQIESITGNRVPIVVVGEKNLFASYMDIDGVIGYEIFMKFEIEINSRQHLLKFRPAMSMLPPRGFTSVPLTIVDSKPVMSSTITFSRDVNTSCELMIDTGSSLGILLKTTDLGSFSNGQGEIIIGRGLNGELRGFQSPIRKMNIHGFEMKNLPPIGIVESKWENRASIGMNILKDYVVILNYCKAYACFRAYT